MRARIPCLMLLWPLAAGCAPSSPEGELLARIEGLRSSGRLPSAEESGVRGADPADVVEFFARLDAAETRLGPAAA